MWYNNISNKQFLPFKNKKMKKIISILLVLVFLSSNISFACQTDADCIAWMETCKITAPLLEWTCVSSITGQPTNNETCNPVCEADEECLFESPTGNRYCSKKTTTNTTSPCTPVMGITCCKEELINGQCKLNIYDTLGIRKTVRDEGDATSVGLFVQDIVLSATFFIGTVVTVALIVSWLMFIFAASSGKDPANAKKGIVGSLIGLLLVVSSYVIIRLVQYIAKGF